MRATCPKNKKHKIFITSVHEVHDWLVDARGEFIKDMGYMCAAQKPDPENIWICAQCGAKAKVRST